ncbi:unnamed protein product [Merluccius merluccius]
MEIVESVTFRIQDSYCVDAIKDFQKGKLSKIVTRLKSKDSVMVLVRRHLVLSFGPLLNWHRHILGLTYRTPSKDELGHAEKGKV